MPGFPNSGKKRERERENPGRGDGLEWERSMSNRRKVTNSGVFPLWDEGTFWNRSTRLGHTT